MSETTYTSPVRAIAADAEQIFGVLADMRHLDRLRDGLGSEQIWSRIPADKQAEAQKLRDLMSNMQADADSISIEAAPLGRIGMHIVDREPHKTIKFAGDNLPFSLYFWIQLKQVAEGDTRIKLTCKADMPIVLKAMAGKKLEQGMERLADMLAMLPYAQMSQNL